MNETRLRDRLIDLATEAPESFVVPAELLRRVHRRTAFVRAASMAAVVALVVGGIFGIRALGGEPDRALQPIKPPNVASDSWIVYRSGSELLAVDPDHPDHAVTVGPSHRLDPIAWSEDASRLLLAYGHETEDLYVVDTDGTRTRLTRAGTSYSGSFSPDGDKVVYDVVDARLDVFRGGLYVVDATGGTPTLLAPADGPTALSDPAWSPDGSRIAFIEATVVGETGRGEPIYRRTLSVVNADGTRRRALIDLGREDRSPTGWARGLTWSPDGSLLAFSSADLDPDHRGAYQIYVVNADGSQLRRLTDSPHNDNPAFSPDGLRMAFACGPRLCTMSADGEDVQEISGAAPTPGSRFVWTSRVPLT